MLYKNFETDEVFDQIGLEEAAANENIGADEYIAKYNLQMMPDSRGPNEIPELKIDPIKSIDTDVDEKIINFNLKTGTLDDLTIDVESSLYQPLRDAEKELERIGRTPSPSLFAWGAKIKIAKDRVTTEKNKLYSADSEMNLEVPETIIYKGEGAVVDFLSQKYKSINIEKAETGDAVRIHLGKKVVILDLQPNTDTGEAAAKEVLKELKAYNDQLNGQEMLSGISMALYRDFER